jgi:hypothetical protein
VYFYFSRYHMVGFLQNWRLMHGLMWNIRSCLHTNDIICNKHIFVCCSLYLAGSIVG